MRFALAVDPRSCNCADLLEGVVLSYIFHEQELDDDGPLSCGNSPRSIKKSRTKRNSLIRRCSSDKGQSKNPYSRVGLDKFSALLSDLEERKKNIYLQRDSQDIKFVRFAYSVSEEVIPIIVKSKDRKKRRQNTTTEKTDGAKSGDEENKPAAAVLVQQAKEEQIAEPNDKKVASDQKRRIKREMNLEKLGRPSYYVPIFVVVILLLLTIFGRSFVILCTSIGWYVIPTLKERTSERTSSSSVVNNNTKKISGAGSSSPTSPKTSFVYRG